MDAGAMLPYPEIHRFDSCLCASILPLPRAILRADCRFYAKIRVSMKILGISAYYHDSAAAIVDDGRIVAAAQEERFSRRRHDSGFPENAIGYCLLDAGVRLNEIDNVVFYDKPWIKFERMLETYLGFAPKGLKSFLIS